MPFLNTQDKAISARLYGSGQRGKKWYNSEAGQLVLQMAGRHVRSHTDYGDFWILDSCFSRVKKTLPEWFVKPIIQTFDYDDDEEEPEGDCDDDEEEPEGDCDDDEEEPEGQKIEEKRSPAADDWDDDKPVPMVGDTKAVQATFDKDMTIDDHSQESAPQANTPDTAKPTQPVVKDESYYDY